MCASEVSPAPQLKKVKRTDNIVRPCPQVCNKDGCVCASEATPSATPQENSKRTDAIVGPCPQVCNKDGCVCAPEKREETLALDELDKRENKNFILVDVDMDSLSKRRVCPLYCVDGVCGCAAENGGDGE